MTDRLIETFTAPTKHKVDAILKTSELLGMRALTVYGACACSLRIASGRVAECGVADGTTARMLRQLMDAALCEGRTLHLFDTFGLMPIAGRNNLAATAVATHARPIEEIGLKGTNVVYESGLFQTTMPTFHIPLCFIHADGDLYESTCEVIRMAARCLLPGGCIIFDDYGTEWTGVTRAVDELLSDPANGDYWTYAVESIGQLVAIRK